MPCLPFDAGGPLLPPLPLWVPVTFREQAIEVGERRVAADEEPEAFAVRLARPPAVPCLTARIVRVEMRASQRLPTAVRTAFYVAPVLVLLADTGTTVGTGFCCCRHCARLRRRVCGIATTFSVVGGWTICSMRSASRSNASARTRPRDKHLGCASAASACALVALFSGTKGLSDLPIHRVEKNSVIWRRKRRHLSVPAITAVLALLFGTVSRQSRQARAAKRWLREIDGR